MQGRKEYENAWTENNSVLDAMFHFAPKLSISFVGNTGINVAPTFPKSSKHFSRARSTATSNKDAIFSGGISGFTCKLTCVNSHTGLNEKRKRKNGKCKHVIWKGYEKIYKSTWAISVETEQTIITCCKAVAKPLSVMRSTTWRRKRSTRISHRSGKQVRKKANER